MEYCILKKNLIKLMRFYIRKLENRINVVFDFTQFDVFSLKTGRIKTANFTNITIYVYIMYKTFSYFTHGFEHQFLNELFD